MPKRDWRIFRFSKANYSKFAMSSIFTVFLLIVLSPITAPVLAQESDDFVYQASVQKPFGGRYVLHLSENARVRSSGRPEPGYFDNLTIKLFNKAELQTEIVAQMPWKREMELAARESGHVIYPATRSEIREDQFKWVGPVSRAIWNLYGFSNKGWSEMSFDKILAQARIGTLMGSARETYLHQRGAQHIIAVPREELLLPMMLADRVDLIAVGGNILRHYINAAKDQDGNEGIPDINGVVPYRSCYLYIAISGDVPDEDVSRLQTVLDGFKTNGFFVKNRAAHGLSTNVEGSFLSAMLNLDNNGVSCIDLDGVGP
ncbi:substrate-binding periplasmic protein [Thalassospira lucentensis]|uniref:substrate-binding periplasmic protein n=1 Tax=Thalassospira lucentensis TaxID=168935 RepID=UPI003D2EC340